MKYARHCTATKIGMNSGWVVNDGEEYYSTERLALKRVKELGYKHLPDAFNAGVCYWTEWEDQDWWKESKQKQKQIIENMKVDNIRNEIQEWLGVDYKITVEKWTRNWRTNEYEWAFNWVDGGFNSLIYCSSLGCSVSGRIDMSSRI